MVPGGKLQCILNFEHGRTIDRAMSFSREVNFMRWFPVACLTNGVVIVTHGGFELTIFAL